MIGYSYFEEGGFCWRFSQNVIMPLSMPHVLDGVNKPLAKKILKEKGGWLLRWDSGLDDYPSSDWWHVIKDGSEVLSELPKKTRYMIRKASEIFLVQQWSKDRVAQECYQVYCNAYKRYQTYEPKFNESEFRDAVNALPANTEFWVVSRKDTDEIAGFAENLVRDNSCFYVSMWLDPEEMRHFAGYLLFHEMNKHYLNGMKLDYVSDGARSISHKTEIHQYLISKFHFRRAYAKLNVVYKPWLYLVVSVLYPARNALSLMPFTIFRKISVVLRQEEIRRKCEKLQGGA
jgi:hypothetical protein